MNELLETSEVVIDNVVSIKPKAKKKKKVVKKGKTKLQLAKIRSDAGKKAAITRQKNDEARKNEEFKNEQERIQQEFELAQKQKVEARRSLKRKVAVLTLIGVSAEVVSQFAGYSFWASMHNGSIAIATMVVLGLLWQVLFFYGGGWSKTIGFFGVVVLAAAPCYQVAQPYVAGLSNQAKQVYTLEEKRDIDQQIDQKLAIKDAKLVEKKVLTDAGRVSKDPAAIKLGDEITQLDKEISKLYTKKSELTKVQANGDEKVDMENKMVNMILRVASIIILSLASMACMHNAGKARKELG